jgi:hypothetical protein
MRLADEGTEKPSSVPCVFLWLADQQKVKVLGRESRVILEADCQAREKPAYVLAPEDRIIIGSASGRWSPADEFTQSLLEAINASHPALVQQVGAWRRGLAAARENRGWSVEELRAHLARVGVEREVQTIEWWLHLDQPIPIAPKSYRKELPAIWKVIAPYTDRQADEVVEACARLKSLRVAAGSALLRLWKGLSLNLGVDDAWLADLVYRLRQEVQVYEVEAVTYGQVPEEMLGWWITPKIAEKFECVPSVHMRNPPPPLL